MRYVPNFLTVLRMALTPFWLVLLYIALYDPSTPHFWWAFIMLFFVAATDFGDGAIAKMKDGRYKSAWGAKWDPIADKGLFWPSVVMVWFWMISHTGAAPTKIELGVCLALSAVMGVLVYSHIRLDIISTKLRSTGESAKQLGRIKFAMDLQTLFLAMLVAWGTDRNNSGIVMGYLLITVSLGLAVSLAHMNVNNRRAAQRLATS